MSDVAVYVQQEYPCRGYDDDCYNKRAWPGMAIIIDALQRGGYEIDYCGRDTVDRHKIILVSMISPIDWYTFIRERIQWPKGDYTVIAGGAGVNNVRPFLEFADVFVFGRGDRVVCDLIAGVLEGNRYHNPKVCYSDEFTPDGEWHTTAPDDTIYPHTVRLQNGREYTERAMGCQRKCSFCDYSWTRPNIGQQSDSSAGTVMWGADTGGEHTIFDLDLDNPESWRLRGVAVFGVDGVSERLRQMVNKPITREMLGKFTAGCRQFVGLTSSIKLYFVCSYPTETRGDWDELRAMVWETDHVIRDRPMGHKTVPMTLQFNHFMPKPATPMACSPVGAYDTIGTIRRKLQHHRCSGYALKLADGMAYTWNISRGVAGVGRERMWLVALRGTEQHAPLVRQMASRKFDALSSDQKRAWLEAHTDMATLSGAYTWETLPTRYLRGIVDNKALAKVFDYRMRKYGGAEGIAIADKVRGIESPPQGQQCETGAESAPRIPELELAE